MIKSKVLITIVSNVVGDSMGFDGDLMNYHTFIMGVSWARDQYPLVN